MSTLDRFPLELFRRELGLHPFHFFQLANAKTPLKGACNAFLFEQSWMDSDKVGRAQIQDAIDGAVEKLSDYLSFHPIPHFVEETLQWPRYDDARVMRFPFMEATRRWTNVRLKEGYVQQVGVEALALINDTAAVTLSDADGDGLNDTFTLTQATAVTDPSLIAVYFSATNRLDSELGHWRIAPVNVVISGGNATITGPAWLLVKPALYQGVAPAVLDPDANGTYVTTLAVYSRSVFTAGQTFADAQSTLIYETRPIPWWGWGWSDSPTGGSTDPAVNGYAVARAQIRNDLIGEVTPAKAAFDPATGTWSEQTLWVTVWEPDRVTVRYLAGYPLTSANQIDHRMVQLVSRFAVAEMDRPILACQEAAREIYHWQFDLARSSGAGDEAYGYISREDLSNPFGTRRGHVWAWKTIKKLKVMRGLSSA